MTVHRAGLALALWCGACDEATPMPTRPPSPRPEPTPFATTPAIEPPARIAEAPLTPALDAWLRDAAVGDDDYARATFFTWTSAKTALRLRHDHELFDDAQLPEGPTAYVQRLQHTGFTDDTAGTLAKLLLGHPDLSRRRYAWVRPWATVLGIVQPYGDQLVRVRLRPEAIVGRYDASQAAPFEFRDLDGRVVPLGRVIAEPARVAAILHISRAADPQYREYVLCNPAMIDQWSLATPEIADVLAADAAALRELAERSTAPAGYADARAFVVPHYDARPENLVAIAEALEHAQPGAPLTVQPRVRFRRRAKVAAVPLRPEPPRLVPIL